MDVIYALLPAMIMLALVSVVVFFWSARQGQYDDLEGPAHRILDDDDDPMLPQDYRNPVEHEKSKQDS